MSKILFVVIAGQSFGFGHLNRCIQIAKFYNKSKTGFFLIGDNKAREILIKDNIHCEGNLDINSSTNNKSLIKLFPRYKKIVYDVSNKKFLNHPCIDYEKLFPTKSAGNKIIVIDSKYSESIVKKEKKLAINLLIIPYLEKKIKNNSKIKCFHGPKFATLAQVYSKIKKRKIRDKVKNILISFGGSDPKLFSLKTLKAIHKLNDQYKVRLIIGPFFKKNLIKSIYNFAYLKKMQIEFLENQKHLKSHFLWSDLAIISSGLTKYEMLATGTPGISISLNNSDYISNKPFTNIGSLQNIKYNTNIMSLCKKIKKLVNNSEIRVRMSKQGQSLVDGRGLLRVANAIEKL